MNYVVRQVSDFHGRSSDFPPLIQHGGVGVLLDNLNLNNVIRVYAKSTILYSRVPTGSSI